MESPSEQQADRGPKTENEGSLGMFQQCVDDTDLVELDLAGITMEENLSTTLLLT